MISSRSGTKSRSRSQEIAEKALNERVQGVSIGNDNWVVAYGVRIARFLPDQMALEFLAPRTSTNRRHQRKVVVRLEELTHLGDG